MLKLRRVEIIGFKSFSDRGEIVVNEAGVTAIVGPNGCGKSNVSDAIAWVLGEQSAKSLRGEKMEDVIFSGTRNRAPMGMAEVTITLTHTIDEHPDVNVHANGNGTANGNGNGHGNGNGNGHANGNGTAVVPQTASGEVVVQRRLYRSGESVYSINGRPCRLRDVQDIFLGTGLGPNSYAIIEQGRVGQLLSSKPSDRRGLIEEAAGITKFKAKRKLAESRLEAARQNLSRVNDILAEVDRQRNSLKRQAGKARRYIEVRNRMRQILGAIFSTRAEQLVDQQEKVELTLAATAGEGKRLEQEIEQLNIAVRQRRSSVSTKERALEETRAHRSELELDYQRSIQRTERLDDQIRSLDDRKTALSDEKTRALEQLDVSKAELDAKTIHLQTVESDKATVEHEVQQMTAVLSELSERRTSEERAIEQLRRQQFEMVGREARIRNEVVSRTEMINRLAAQTERLTREELESRSQAQELDGELTRAREAYSSHQTGFAELKQQLHECEQTHARYKSEHVDAVKAAFAAKANEESLRNRLQTIGELAVQRAYSTESVQQFFNHVRGLEWAPLGILADFVEVDGEYESLVEDFLRGQLQFVVVQDRVQAARAVDVVRNVSKGRLDCLVLNGNTVPNGPVEIDNATPLCNVMRFDDRVRHFQEYIRDAYIVPDIDRAWELAARYPHCSFICRSGEVVRGHIVSWGEHEALGPLSLKREIRELDRKMDAAIRTTAALQGEVARLEDLVQQSEALKARLSHELQESEKAILTMDHRVRSLHADFQRAEQRWKVATAETGRLTAERADLESALVRAEVQLTDIAAEKSAIEEETLIRVKSSEQLLQDVEAKRRDFAGLQSQLAVLEERRSTITRELNSLRQQAVNLEEQVKRAERNIEQADQQQHEARTTIEELAAARIDLISERDRLDAELAETTSGLDLLRQELQESEAKWDEKRGLLDSWKDRHNALEIERTQVDSDLKHLADSCLNELHETIESICLKYFDALPPEQLEVSEQEYRELRERVESMGAVNMMAVDEYQEAEERFTFLSAQRQDLLDSIRDTAQAIEEIDSVCRRQFKEAFETINAGFKDAFLTLFGGGHGELRLLESADQLDAGVEIVAQPKGKKLQNVLLLSGGEKALTALALLIALFRYKPSPFCVLDEVDAPLDEANVDRFANMVREMSRETQFIVITHSKRTMETASTLYGVTMEEPGISKIVSVKLN